MKYVQVVEPAENCCFLVHAVNDKDFSLIFPTIGQDLEFVEDLFKRLGKHRAGKLIARVTSKWVPKSEVRGIHGTVFFGYSKRRKHFPNKRESDLDSIPLGRPQNRVKNTKR